jgi:hypothetical protein
MSSTGKIIVALFIGVTLLVPFRSPAAAGTMQTYVVLYKAQAVPANAATTIARAGGTHVYTYDAIGVAIARSDDPLFR